MKSLTKQKIRTIVPGMITGAMLIFLLTGQHHQRVMPCKNFNIPPQEFFKQDVESCTEPDSGTEKSNMETTTSAFMIGLPLLN